MYGRSFSAKAAQTEIGRGCFGFDLDLVRPRLHSWPSSSSSTYAIEDATLDNTVEAVVLVNTVVVLKASS